ncbi:MAG: PAS domain S-box protein [Pseudomonadota bacterium]
MNVTHLSLRHWLPLSVLLAFGLVLGALSGLQLSDFREQARRDAQTRVSIQGRALQYHLEEEIRLGGLEHIQNAFSLLATIPEVTAGALVSSEGVILAGNRMEWRQEPGNQLQDFSPQDFRTTRETNRTVNRWLDKDRTLTYYLPVSLPSQDQLRPTVGVLYIRYDNGPVLDHAAAQALNRFLITLAASLSVLGLLMWRIHKRLLRPLQHLDSALRTFGAGQHHTRLPVPDDLDLARLARAFNDMADHQQQLLDELTRSQQNLSATLDSIGDAVIVTDAQGCITRMNAVAEALTAWSLEDAHGRPIEMIMMLVDNRGSPLVPMPVRQVLESGQVMHLANHTKLVRRDGSEVHIADSAAPIRGRDGAISGVIMVCRDVNQEYALRESLREREAIYRLMTEQTTSFDYWQDPEGHYRYISPTCEQITGYSAEAFASEPDFIARIAHPDDQALLHRHGEETRHPGLPQHSMEFRIINRQGQVRWLHHLCQDVFADDGTWLGRRSSNLDITDHKADQEALARQASELQALVDKRTQQLMRSNNALMEASRAKDEFLAAMSHELRTPLTAILGLTELLREPSLGSLSPKQGRYVRQIEDSGHHLLELINDILDVAKIEAGKLTLEAGEVQVSKVVESSLTMVREAARAKNLRLTLAEDGRVARLRGDARRIRQALVNLLSNAIKFTPEGGQIGLEVMGDDHDKIARFTVWDTGIGISLEDQARLFHPFTQVDSSLGREYNGTGLGLVLVKSMIELHHGQIFVQSEPGRGSRFSFTLPWDPDEHWESTEAAPQPASREDNPALSGPAGSIHRVLLVDDNEVNREMAREFLEIGGYMVITAEDGKQALEALQRDPLPELVLLDVQMPVLDGPATLAALRQNPRTARLPVVALTALAMSGDRERLLEQGFDAYLAKPYQIDALLQVVTETLEKAPRP